MSSLNMTHELTLWDRLKSLSKWSQVSWLAGVPAAVVASVVAVIAFYLDSRVTVAGDSLTWFEWFGLAGVVFTILALILTLVQLMRVASASLEARRAVDDALRALGKSDLFIDFSEIRRIDSELESIADNNDPNDLDALRRLVRDVRDISARVTTALAQQNEDDPLIGEIDAARAAALELRKTLLSPRKNMNLEVATRKLREQLVPACESITHRISEMRLDMAPKE
jgi:anti-anti-sigma regulatory factor